MALVNPLQDLDVMGRVYMRRSRVEIRRAQHKAKAWLFRRFRFACPFSPCRNPRFRQAPLLSRTVRSLASYAADHIRRGKTARPERGAEGRPVTGIPAVRYHQHTVWSSRKSGSWFASGSGRGSSSIQPVLECLLLLHSRRPSILQEGQVVVVFGSLNCTISRYNSSQTGVYLGCRCIMLYPVPGVC
jgi:hypothetical protein